MSPTCSTSETSGSALIAATNAGVASVSAVSVGVVPYGASPYIATVDGADESAPGTLHLTCTVAEAAQPGLESPSEALTVTVTGPGAVHLNEGCALVTSLSVPELADH